MTLKIVCIEDQEDILALERTLLLSQGHEVIAPVVFSWALNEDYWVGVDVALVDLSIPGATSGREILRWLAENVSGVRRICVTAEPFITAEEVRAHDIIRKPFGLTEFIRAVKSG